MTASPTAPAESTSPHGAGATVPYLHDWWTPRPRAQDTTNTPPADKPAGSTTAPDGGAGDVLRDREEKRDAMVEELRSRLKETADRLASVIQGYVEGKAGGKETARIRAAVMQTELTELLDLIEREGLADAREQWFAGYKQIVGLAEEQLAAAGVDNADRLLDGEAAVASIRAARDRDAGEFWEDQIARPSAHRVLRGLQTSIELQPLEEVARIVARDEGVSLPQATTLAATRVAEFDRFAVAEAARQADPDGDRLMWAYTGPDDGIERPFCDALNGKYFTREQVGRLDNSQPGTAHPIFSGGGYRCRHQWLQATAAVLERLRDQRGTDADIDAANRDAAAGRGRKAA